MSDQVFYNTKDYDDISAINADIDVARLRGRKGVVYRWTDDTGQARTSTYFSDDKEEDMDDLRAYVQKHLANFPHSVHVSAVVDGIASLPGLKFLPAKNEDH